MLTFSLKGLSRSLICMAYPYDRSLILDHGGPTNGTLPISCLKEAMFISCLFFTTNMYSSYMTVSIHYHKVKGVVSAKYSAGFSRNSYIIRFIPTGFQVYGQTVRQKKDCIKQRH